MSTDEGVSDRRTTGLADGSTMPTIALGVWQVANGQECVNAVRWALESGYRHIDTAQAYGNEESVGEGIRQSGVPRDEMFITTKFYPARRDPVAEVEQSLQRLGVEHVDLYIIHWPQRGPVWAWPGMERARDLGYARSIGVSNFSADDLEQLRPTWGTAPVIDQVQFSPFEYRRGLLDACERSGIVLEAYSPLGTGRHLSNKTLMHIAQRVGRTPAQVLLRWCLQHDVPVVTKSTHRERIEENIAIFDFSLSEADMGELDSLDRTKGTTRANEHKWW
jgi:diketogulonate reductase-like aldo/keto reductase